MFPSRTLFIIAAMAPAIAGAQSPNPDSARSVTSARTLLDTYVREALSRNLALAQHGIAERRADASVREANGRLLPTVGFNARYSAVSGVVNIGDFINPAYSALNQLIGQSRFPTNINSTLPQRQETRFAVAQPLYNDALFGARDVTRALREARGAERRALARQLSADVQLAWLAYASATRVVETLQATLPVLDENLRVSERLVSNGHATVDATYRARAERSELQQQLADSKQRQAAARRMFNLLRDRDADSEIALADDCSLLTADTLTLSEAIAHAVTHREELEAADQGIRVASGQRRIALSAWKPSVALVADYGVQGDRYHFDRQHDVSTASLVISWNAFNGGQDAARREQASLARDEASLRRREAEQSIRTQVAVSRDALIGARASLTTADDRLEAARRTFALVERRYAEGLAPPVDFLVARTAYTNAAINQVLTRYAFAARAVEFERAAALREVSK